MNPWVEILVAAGFGATVAVLLAAAQDYVRRRRALAMLHADISEILRNVEMIWSQVQPSQEVARVLGVVNALRLLAGRFENSTEWFMASMGTPALGAATEFYTGLMLTRGAASIWHHDHRRSGGWARDAHADLEEYVQGVRAGGSEALLAVDRARERLQPLDWLRDMIEAGSVRSRFQIGPLFSGRRISLRDRRQVSWAAP